MLDVVQVQYNKMVKQQVKEDKDSKANPENFDDDVTQVAQIQNVSIKSHLTCIKCNANKACSKDRYKKLLQKYGSEEEIAKDYICRSCR
jgi:hypothetical protein